MTTTSILYGIGNIIFSNVSNLNPFIGLGLPIYSMVPVVFSYSGLTYLCPLDPWGHTPSWVEWLLRAARVRLILSFTEK